MRSGGREAAAPGSGGYQGKVKIQSDTKYES